MDARTDDALILHRHSNKPILRIGVQAQFYFPNGAEPGVRAAAIDALAAYAGLVEPHVTRILPNGSKRLAALAKADFPDRQRRQAVESAPGKVFGITLCEDQPVPLFQGVAQLLGDDAPDWLSYVHMAIPGSFMKGGSDRYVAAIVDWAGIVKPEYGTAGFAPIAEPGMELQWPHESWPLLSRFCGLDFLGAFNLKRKPGCIQAVNWLTVLGQAALDAIGGCTRLEARLAQARADLAPDGPDFALYDFDGGVVIRAGQYPQIGDRETDGVPETYRALSAALRPIIFTAYRDRPGDLIKLPPGLDRHRETLNWIRRFDGDRQEPDFG